jgi:uncharacterized protein (TIGR00251 family)
MTGWLAARDTGVLIRVRVQPRASRTEAAGEHGDAIRIRVAAPPVDGEANSELVRFLARTLGVARDAIRIRSGSAGRSKLIEVDGVTAASVRAALLG